MPDEKSNTDCTIVSIDNSLATLNRRLSAIRDNLHDGIHGESPRESDADKCEISTPSLSSISTRIDDMAGEISVIENYVNKIHQSHKIGS